MPSIRGKISLAHPFFKLLRSIIIDVFPMLWSWYNLGPLPRIDVEMIEWLGTTLLI